MQFKLTKMSANFCILIPSKVLQLEKRFPETLQVYVAARGNEFYSSHPVPNSRLPSYSLITLLEFQARLDVHLDLPAKMYSRYHVIDWGFDFLQSSVLQSLFSWLAEIYVYGEVGLLKYWSDERKRYPPITVGSTKESVSKLSTSELPLDKILFFPLTCYLI